DPVPVQLVKQGDLLLLVSALDENEELWPQRREFQRSPTGRLVLGDAVPKRRQRRRVALGLLPQGASRFQVRLGQRRQAIQRQQQLAGLVRRHVEHFHVHQQVRLQLAAEVAVDQL